MERISYNKGLMVYKNIYGRDNKRKKYTGSKIENYL